MNYGGRGFGLYAKKARGRQEGSCVATSQEVQDRDAYQSLMNVRAKGQRTLR